MSMEPAVPVAMVMKAIIEGIERDLGRTALFELIVALDRHGQWHTEIIASRSEVDQILLDRHGSFDQDIWVKIQDTQAWVEFHEKIYRLTQMYLQKAVDEVVYGELA